MNNISQMHVPSDLKFRQHESDKKNSKGGGYNREVEVKKPILDKVLIRKGPCTTLLLN